jgi:peroxiredoxin
MLERLQQMLGIRGINLVAVSVDRDDKSAVAGFLDRIGVKRLHVFLDPEGRVGVRSPEEGVSPFVLYGLPITYVIDRQGRAAGYIAGDVDWASQEGLALLRRYAVAQ